MPLVLVRTPTYRRPALLMRALKCLQAQTHQDWVCEVRDDCPDGSALSVVEELGDRRVHYKPNRPQKYMVKNLDDCYLRENEFSADHFFMLEDDNQVRPEFMSKGIDINRQMGVSICQMNQVVEHNSEPGGSRIGDVGIFDAHFDEKVYTPQEFRLSMFGATGISNGAVFWSKTIKNELAVKVATIPTLEEYLRTVLLSEPIYICLERLAVWAENEQTTTRNLGLDKNWLRRELDLKASITTLQRAVWKTTSPDLRQSFLDGGVVRTPVAQRQVALAKAGIRFPGAPSESVKARIKRMGVRAMGRVHPSVSSCLER